MDSVLLESPMGATAHRPFASPLCGPGYESILRDSIDRFLSELRRGGATDFSGLRAVSSRLLHSSLDPPLEAIWLHSALAYHSRHDVPDPIPAVKDLLHLLLSCSAASAGPKPVALLAPVLAEIHHFLLKSPDTRVRRELELILDGVLGYISICCSKASSLTDEPLRCFSELVRVWAARRLELGSDGDGMGVLFPLVSEDIRGSFGREGCGVGYLAGVVIAEAFLMRLCLKVKEGSGSRADFQKELRISAVSSITVFRDCIFFEILLRLLLEPTLPVMSILNPKDESILREILYDAVILVEYSFLHPAPGSEQSYGRMASLAIERLIVTHEAIRISRSKGELDKAISYISAFSTSSLPNGLIKLVSNQVGMENLDRPSATTPAVLLKWLVDLEQRGLGLFGESMSKHSSKLVFVEPQALPGTTVANPNSIKTDADLFFIDNQGKVTEDAAEDEDMEPMDGIFQAAARSMKSTACNGRKKRKDYGAEDGVQVKSVKYKIHDSSVKDYFARSMADGMSSGSEVENPLSDDEMEEIEH